MVIDYDLILLCKKGDQSAQITLFDKYAPFLYKKYSSKRRSGLLYAITFQDFKNEAFIWFLKAVEYIDISRIYDPKKWKFFTPFMYFIGTMIKSLMDQERGYNVTKKDSKTNPPISLDTGHFRPEDSSEDTGLWSHIGNQTLFDDPVSHGVIEKISCELFIDTLSPFQKKIIQSAQKKEEDKTPNLQVLADRLKVSRSWMARSIQKMKIKFRSFSKEYLY